MKTAFYSYWVFYLATWSLEYLINPMSLDMAKIIMHMYWLSFLFLAIFPVSYVYITEKSNDKYLEGFIACVLARGLLKFGEFYGYSDKRTAIAITGFAMLMWIGFNMKRKLDRLSNKTLL